VKPARIVTAVLGAFLLVLITAIVLLSPGAGGLRDSARSSTPRGRMAAFLILEELGFEPELWRKPPGELPGGEHVLWMPRPPAEFADYEESADFAGDPLELAREGSDFSPRHYRSFMETGGVLVLPASDDALAFLQNGLGLETGPLERWRLDRLPVLEDGELELREREGRREYHDSNDQLIALEVEVEDGAFALLADGPWPRNQRLEDGDRALALVRVLEDLVARRAPEGRFLLDEHVLGWTSHEGPLDLAFSAEARLLSLHVLLLALLATWARSWAREFPRDPRPHEQLSPLARARAQAGLLLRARRFEVLAGFLREGTLRGLGDATPPGWTDALAGRTVDDLDGLVRLDRDLRAFEHGAESEYTDADRKR
jgi:hypothetical protein